MNLKTNIVQLLKIKSAIFEIDNGKLWPYHLPKVAATEEELLSLESVLKTNLDQEYRSFLNLANGWPGFYQTVDLFGTNELLDQKAYSGFQEQLKAGLEFNSSSEFSLEDAIIIAATKEDLDMFLLTTEKNHAPGRVIWFAGEIVDIFSSFNEFYLSMISYNLKELEDLKKELK
jgi:hypothetical protein